MARLMTQVRIRQGDDVLKNLNAKFDLTVIDDDQNLSSGLISRSITTGTTDLEVTLSDYGLTNAEFLMIESDQDITVKFNLNSNPAIDIKKPRRNPSGQVVDASVRRVGFMALSTDNIASIFLTNSSGNLANVRILATDYLAT